MAETKEKAAEKPAKSGKSPKPEGKGKEKGAAAGATHPAPKAVEGTPRLKTYYDKVIRPNLAKEFGLTNTHQVPRILKVVLNVGMGEAARTPKMLDAVVAKLGGITAQKATIRRSKRPTGRRACRSGARLPCGTPGCRSSWIASSTSRSPGFVTSAGCRTRASMD